MKTVTGLLVFVVLSGFARGASAPEPVATGFGFSLIPNAFTANPTLAMTVNTEFTAYGRAQPAPVAGVPVLFEAHDSGLQSQGLIIGGQKTPTPDALRQTLFQALTEAGYQPAAVGQQSQVALVYYWGSHYSLDRDLAALFPELEHQRVLERAMLIGGSALKEQLMNEYDFGYTLNDRTPRKLFLRQQAWDNLCFVVVSAYDYRELASDHRRLLWRTTMTVSTQGVSMRDTLPPLLLTAAPYLGRETLEPVAIHRQVRRGTVKLGPLHVVADN